jgi:aminobenzoyl-glutamate utilization protein B
MPTVRLLIVLSCVLSTVAAANAGADDLRADLLRRLDARTATFDELAREVWAHPEPGFQERESSAILQRALAGAGFRVRASLGGMPTAFVAEWGSGRPVIGIMGEFDALPGMSQQAVPERRPVTDGGYGHACGHNLLGAGSALAAAAVRDVLEAGKLPGTVRFYGTPAEEGGNGKVYMLRAGLFQDVDVVLHWHPNDRNVATMQSTLAMMSARFTFTGRAAHAAAAPDRGRSALDGLLLMAHAVDMLREHVPQETRLHYVITNGGDAPNIVPAKAEMYLYARHPRMATLDGIWARILKCAQAGALASDTDVQVALSGSTYDILPNDALSSLIDTNLREVGGVAYTAEERAFAEAIRATLPSEHALPMGAESTIRPRDEPFTLGSTDAGDVSWAVPTGWVIAATWVPGTANHTWQAAATAGTSVGRKGMHVAARTLALTALDLFTDPAKVAAARADFEARRQGLEYRSRIPAGMPPPLDYRQTQP